MLINYSHLLRFILFALIIYSILILSAQQFWYVLQFISFYN